MNAQALSDTAIQQRVGRLLDGFASKPIMIQTNAVFRARKNDDGQSFEKASELWYPPPQVLKLGRFNAEGESVFYASGSINASLWEMRPKPGEQFTVLVCGSRQMHARIECAHIGLQLYGGIQQSKEYPFPDLRGDLAFRRQLQAEMLDKKWERLDDFFSELVTTQPDDRPGLYRITQALGAILADMIPDGGLSYPSVATALKAFNLRLPRHVADEHFFPAEAWEFRILAHFDELPNAPPSAVGYQMTQAIRRSESITADGNIQWGPQDFDMQGEFSTIMSRVAEARKLFS